MNHNYSDLLKQRMAELKEQVGGDFNEYLHRCIDKINQQLALGPIESDKALVLLVASVSIRDGALRRLLCYLIAKGELGIVLAFLTYLPKLNNWEYFLNRVSAFASTGYYGTPDRHPIIHQCRILRRARATGSL